MAIDPREYDLAELRTASAGGSLLDARETPVERDESTAGDSGAGDRPPAAAAFERAVARDLVTFEAAADDLERPYLDALPASLVGEALVFEWLEFLVLRTGRESAADALAFYATVGWLSEDAAAALESYLPGIEDVPDRAASNGDLDADAHRVSLDYVARLASL